MDHALLKLCKACGTEISRHSPFHRNYGHSQGSNLVIGLLVLFLLVMFASYIAFMVYCACHAEDFAI